MRAIAIQSHSSESGRGEQATVLRTRCAGRKTSWVLAAMAAQTMAGQASQHPAVTNHLMSNAWVAAAGLLGLALLLFASARRFRGRPSNTRVNPFSVRTSRVPPGSTTRFRRIGQPTGPAPAGMEAPASGGFARDPLAASLSPSESFIYAAAHDLQEPLRKVRTYLGRLDNHLQAASCAEARTEGEHMRRTLNRMQSLLDSLLSLARIRGDGGGFVPVDLGELLREVLADLEPRILENQAEVSVEGSLPSLEADPIQLRQLLQNLLSNAIKFHAAQRKPKVQITVTVVEPEAGSAHRKCEVLIRDNGIGFDPQEWPRLLQGFNRQHSRDRYEGTGLGLAICRTILERHRGEWSAKSAPDEGTTICLKLPMTQVPPTCPAGRLSSPAATAGDVRSP